MWSFCVPAILGTYTIFFIEAFLTPGAFRPLYPSKNEIIKAIAMLVGVCYIDYKMLRRIYNSAVKRVYNKSAAHVAILLSAYWGLFSIGVEALNFFQSSIRSWCGWVLCAYFIYGIYIAAGIHKNHLVPN